MTDSNQTCDHFVMYKNTKSLYCTPESNNGASQLYLNLKKKKINFHFFHLSFLRSKYNSLVGICILNTNFLMLGNASLTCLSCDIKDCLLWVGPWAGKGSYQIWSVIKQACHLGYTTQWTVWYYSFLGWERAPCGVCQASIGESKCIHLKFWRRPYHPCRELYSCPFRSSPPPCGCGCGISERCCGETCFPKPVEWSHTGSLKSALVGIFTPRKL